ncbi:CotD family spore coat protein [Metabacillus herbersteinensis]|uniref:CotD family spore coat protein n=1 Tax=Metabacillus herbersteinensis TaxID=283816 RepID=A0ABV6GDA4_9BACI
MHCKPKMMAPIVHPTKCCVQNNYSETIVPHIHPQHTTIVNHEHFKHQHYFPQTQSVVNEVTNQQFNAYGPRPGFGGPGGPGFAGGAPGGYPGPGGRPGFGGPFGR